MSQNLICEGKTVPKNFQLGMYLMIFSISDKCRYTFENIHSNFINVKTRKCYNTKLLEYSLHHSFEVLLATHPIILFCAFRELEAIIDFQELSFSTRTKIIET